MISRCVLFVAALGATPVQPPPLFDNLGNHRHSIRTNTPGVQRYFDQGLRLLYAFNHDEAFRDFQEAVRRDPQCLMCLWGVALSLGPHINVARDAEKEKLAWETLQRAQALAPRATAREMAAMFPEEMVGHMEASMPGVDYYLGPPLLALIRFGRWQDALNYPKPPDSFRYLNALWHYARSLALIRTGKLTAAEEEQSQLTSFAQRLAPDAVIGNNSAVAIFAVVTKTLEGELAASKGNFAEAIRLLGEAVSLEDRLGYEEPPAWYQPVRLSLGAVLLRAGQAAEAEAVYREDLHRNPENGWALFGLMKSLDGRSQEAATVKARFRKAWARADVKLTESRF
jgi:tetratricopeptide (TPR) repeat protein